MNVEDMDAIAGIIIGVIAVLSFMTWNTVSLRKEKNK